MAIVKKAIHGVLKAKASGLIWDAKLPSVLKRSNQHKILGGRDFYLLGCGNKKGRQTC
jgi:hypothetical protein